MPPRLASISRVIPTEIPRVLGEDSDGGRSQARFLCLCVCLREGLTCIALKNDAFGSKYPWYLVRRFYGPRLTHSLPSPESFWHPWSASAMARPLNLALLRGREEAPPLPPWHAIVPRQL